MAVGPVVLVLVATVIGLGCGRPSARPPAPPSAGAPAPDPMEEGDALVARGDRVAAVARYREALRVRPHDVAVRYRLGAALSHLDVTDEAATHFRWVVDHGDPGRPEVALAREWLLGTAGEGTPEAAPASAAAAVDGVGSVRGRTEWPGVTPEDVRTLEIRITGAEGTTGRRRLRVRLGRPYTLSKVPAGTYRLEGRSAGVTLWDARVTVQADRETVLDLTPATALVATGAFPPPAK
jgi:hypothetical protein